MGNCWYRCFGKVDSRTLLRTRYNVDGDFSVEFENLMDEDRNQDEMTRLVTEREKQLVKSRQFDLLLHEQKKLDAEIDAELARQEEELRLEEEAYYEAKREATRVAKLQKEKAKAAKTNQKNKNGPKAWLGDDENDWDVAGGEDDFELFLESVRARSLTARTAAGINNPGQDSPSSGTTGSNRSNQTTSRDRSQTEGSSMELEWEHEQGVVPQGKAHRTQTEEDIVNMSKKQRDTKADPSSDSGELEWDHDFVSAEEVESEQLLNEDLKHIGGDSDGLER